MYSQALLLMARFDDKFLELASLLRQLQKTAPDDFKRLLAIQQLVGMRRDDLVGLPERSATSTCRASA